MVKPVTVNDVLDGHVVLDLECLDRVYLNAYLPNLQVGGQVVSFLTAHLGYPIPSPAVFDLNPYHRPFGQVTSRTRHDRPYNLTQDPLDTERSRLARRALQGAIVEQACTTPAEERCGDATPPVVQPPRTRSTSGPLSWR